MNINEALNILNLAGTVNQDTIKKAYKKMANQFHPDRNP
ncbi:DnaJ domain-containing protein, partial [Glaesserella parasuis]